MWCMPFIIIYDCNNYGNNNDNLDRAMNQSCSDFRIRNRAWTWIKNKALLIKVCVVNHLRVYLVHNFYYLGTMKFSFSFFLYLFIYSPIHQFRLLYSLFFPVRSPLPVPNIKLYASDVVWFDRILISVSSPQAVNVVFSLLSLSLISLLVTFSVCKQRSKREYVLLFLSCSRKLNGQNRRCVSLISNVTQQYRSCLHPEDGLQIFELLWRCFCNCCCR